MRNSTAQALLLALVLVVGCGRAAPRLEPAHQPVSEPTRRDSDSTPARPAAEFVESPSYKLWNNFPVGTTLKQRTTTTNEANPGQTTTDIVFTLKEKTAESLLVETQATTTHADGRVTANPAIENRYARLFPLPPGTKKEDWNKGQAEEGALEVIRIQGKSYPCRKTQGKSFTDAGEMLTETWSSVEMPGGLVKSVSVVPKVKVTSTIEVTEFKMPPSR